MKDITRDGYREVVYADRSLKGARHFVKFLIQIDGQNKSGSCKHFIFDARGHASLASITEWVSRPGVDGNLKPYEDELAAMFGPLDLYMRTAHIAQRPTKSLPDLTDATAGEKKALFVEIAGIDYLQRFSEAANEKAKLEDNAARETTISMQPIRSMVAGKGDEQRRLRESKDELKSVEALLESVTARGREAKADLEKRQEAWNAEQARREKETAARREMDTVQGEIASLTEEIARYREAAKNREGYESALAEHETLRKTVEGEREEERVHDKAQAEKDEIVGNGYDLSINKYKQSVYAEESYPHPREILAEINALEREIQNGLKELEALIDG